MSEYCLHDCNGKSTSKNGFSEKKKVVSLPESGNYKIFRQWEACIQRCRIIWQMEKTDSEFTKTQGV